MLILMKVSLHQISHYVSLICPWLHNFHHCVCKLLSLIFVHRCRVYYKIMVFRDVTPSSLVDRYSRFRRTCYCLLPLPWSWRKRVPLKRYQSTKRHGVRSQKTTILIFTAVRSSNLITQLLKMEADGYSEALVPGQSTWLERVRPRVCL
jgi:hypothetical protein